MKDVKTVDIVDAIASIYAADEHQAQLVKMLNPTFEREGHKPSASMWVPVQQSGEPSDTENTCVPSVKDFAAKTLGLENNWTDDASVAVNVSDEHRTAAEEAIAAITNRVMMMVLQGKTVNGFLGNMSKKLEETEVSARDIGLLTYVPKTAKQFMETAAVDEIKAQYTNSKPLGQEGQKVEAIVTIFNVRVMPQYDSILHEGYDDQGNLVTFFKNQASKDQFNVGETYKIAGKIKNVGETAYSFGAIVNTLNYVRKAK